MKTIAVKAGLKPLLCTAMVLKVSDVLELYRLIGTDIYKPETSAALIEKHQLSLIELAKSALRFNQSVNLSKLSKENLSIVLAHFIDVNQCFFKQQADDGFNDFDYIELLSGNELFENLAGEVAIMIQHGNHFNALSYPWDYYIVARDIFHEWINQQK